jgi:hypothetical protein
LILQQIPGPFLFIGLLDTSLKAQNRQQTCSL